MSDFESSLETISSEALNLKWMEENKMICNQCRWSKPDHQFPTEGSVCKSCLQANTLPLVIVDAYRSWDEISSKYAAWAGHYDRTHSDNVKLGKRWSRLMKLIEAAELDPMKTLALLANSVK